MTILHFVGTRSKDFTVDGPVTGERYYVAIGQPVEVADADADALLARDPQLWERAEKPAKRPSKSMEL